MTLAWPLVALVAVLLAWHRVGQWLAQRKAQQAQSEVVRGEVQALETELRGWVSAQTATAGRVTELEEWRQRTLNRNGGRE